MPSFVALLRAVNVGGTGKLVMTDLKAEREAAGASRSMPSVSPADY